jgi:hypothetical protein
MARAVRRADATECRQCLTYCDRVIAPATCVASRCPSLYRYDDPLSGNRYMGCTLKVFATEVDVAMFEEAERARGYGTLKLAREPTARCAFSVERAHERPKGDEFHCTNRRFFDFPERGPGGVRAFDLREGLSAA